MKTRTKLYCAAGTLAALTGFYLLGAHESPAQPAQVAQHPSNVRTAQTATPSPSPSPSPAASAPGKADRVRCAEAVTKAALVINQVDPGRFDNPYEVCPGTKTQILTRIRDEAAQLAELPH